MERPTMSIVNTLNGSGGGLNIARASGTNGNPSDIGACLLAGFRNLSAHEVSGPKSPDHTGLLGCRIGEAAATSPAHLPSVPAHGGDRHGDNVAHQKMGWRALSHTGRVHPMRLGQPALDAIVLGSP